MPAQFEKLIKKEGLLPVFEKLSYTHRKEYCRWITDAKKEETRLKRLGKAIEMLKKGISTLGRIRSRELHYECLRLGAPC